MPGRRRPAFIMASSMFVAGWTLTQGFCFVPALTSCSVNVGRSASTSSEGRCRATERSDASRQGGLTMRGLHKKGKNGPGLTGVQRVLNTRERVQVVADPCRVMISNLDFTLTEGDVKEFCSTAGLVAAVKLVKRRYAKTSRGFGFVDFEQPIMATVAIEDLNGTELRGRRVEIKPAILPRERQAREATEAWAERQALERERRSVEGYSDEAEPDNEEERRKPETSGTSKGRKSSTPSTEDYMSLLTSRRVKPKPQVRIDSE